MALPTSQGSFDALKGKPGGYAGMDGHGGLLFNIFVQDGIGINSLGNGYWGPLPSDYHFAGLWVGKAFEEIGDDNYHILVNGASSNPPSYIRLNAPGSGGQVVLQVNAVSIVTTSSTGVGIFGNLSCSGNFAVGGSTFTVSPSLGTATITSGATGELHLNGPDGGGIKFQLNGTDVYTLESGIDAPGTVTLRNDATGASVVKWAADNSTTFTSLVTFAGVTTFAGGASLPKGVSVHWGDPNNSIRVDDAPAWFPDRANVVTISAFGAAGSGAFAVRDAGTNTVWFSVSLEDGATSFFGGAPVLRQAALADTSGATLLQLEAEVNALKARLRNLNLMAT